MPKCHNFSNCYMELCRQAHQRPLSIVCVMLPHSLDFTTDRVKMDDWGPILQALSLDRALNTISIRSRYQSRKPLEEMITENRARNVAKIPVILTRFVLEKLSHSITQCVRNSQELKSLDLEGIPLPIDCLAVLCMGLSATQSLRHLSLRRCHIGDEGCEMICRVVLKIQSIRTLNLSQCDLTSRCGTALATALSRQKLTLYHDAWMQSLRYRQPDLEAMPGLRRLTLNGNPKLGDSVVLKLIEAVGDSLWLKALDLQNCGLTNDVVEEIVGLIKRNEKLLVVDVRKNSHFSEAFPEEIISILDERNEDGKSEYRWLDLPRSKIQGAKSAHCLAKPRLEQAASVARPKSAFVQRSKPRPPVPARRTPPTPLAVTVKRPKTKPQLSPKNPAESVVEEAAKASLHLDIQSQLYPSFEALNVDEVAEKEIIMDEAKKSEALLAQLKSEYGRLLEQTEKKDLLLSEERSRCEKAEAKFRSLESTVKDLEEALKEKERETQGFLLIDRETLDEICKFLETLDEMTRNSNESGSSGSSVELNQEHIRRRIDLLIRKTKSEYRERAYAQLEDVPTCRKLVKSEGDIHAPPPTPPRAPVYPERHIGDSPAVMSPVVQESARRKVAEMPHKLARAIFEQILKEGEFSRI